MVNQAEEIALLIAKGHDKAEQGSERHGRISILSDRELEQGILQIIVIISQERRGIQQYRELVCEKVGSFCGKIVFVRDLTAVTANNSDLFARRMELLASGPGRFADHPGKLANNLCEIYRVPGPRRAFQMFHRCNKE